nr:MAG TPA: hypothetical protein [Caudoviricetes sp.]
MRLCPILGLRSSNLPVIMLKNTKTAVLKHGQKQLLLVPI